MIDPIMVAVVAGSMTSAGLAGRVFTQSRFLIWLAFTIGGSILSYIMLITLYSIEERGALFAVFFTGSTMMLSLLAAVALRFVRLR
jgi:hypothetical protein